MEINRIFHDHEITYSVKGAEVVSENPIFIYGLEDELPVADFPGLVLVTLTGADWEKDFSPYPHSKVFHGGHDFAGQGPLFLARLFKMAPVIEDALSLKPSQRILSGYSLAGLAALDASLTSDLFAGIACVSGSVWYPGYLSKLAKTPCLAKAVYFSIGSHESETRNPILSTAKDCQEKAAALLAKQGKKTLFEVNGGGHFVDVTPRVEKGIRWLLENLS
jgi:predicted alpha/beta superfamily hydrolase